MRSTASAALRLQYYAGLFLAGLIVSLAVLLTQPAPGYMDADYYLYGGTRLVEGYGFTEDVVWNYLGDPDALPAPSHGYWMPAASVWAALGLWAWRGSAWMGGRVGFLLLAAFLPVFTAWFATHLTHNPKHGKLAGWLAVFSGFYLPFLSNVDTFVMYMLLGSLFILFVGRGGTAQTNKQIAGWMLGVGAVVGLMHYTRADGLIWLGIAGLVMMLTRRRFSTTMMAVFALLGGYGLVFAPWMLRNVRAFGSLLAPGSSRAVWLTSYNDLFAFPAEMLTVAHWWETGFAQIYMARMDALGLNLQTALVVQGAIFLLPLIIVGGKRLWGDMRVRVGLLAWLTMFVLMTFVFPFAGARGGFFHAGAAVQPLFWTLAAVGLDAFVSWGTQVRGWKPQAAYSVFGAGVIGLVALISGVVFTQRILPDDAQTVYLTYQQVDEVLVVWGAQPDDLVLVNNPPAYALSTGRAALVVPSSGVSSVLAAADQFGARYLLLDVNFPPTLENLYRDPATQSGLTLLGQVEDIVIYQVMP